MANHLETVRTFIAIDIDRTVRGELMKLQQRLKRAHADIKWVNPGNTHPCSLSRILAHHRLDDAAKVHGALRAQAQTLVSPGFVSPETLPTKGFMYGASQLK